MEGHRRAPAKARVLLTSAPGPQDARERARRQRRVAEERGAVLPANGDGGRADDNARSAACLMMLPLSGTGSPDWVELAFIVRDALLMSNRSVSALGGKQRALQIAPGGFLVPYYR